MTLLELILRLQYLATFLDDPEHIRVRVVDDIGGVFYSVSRVELTDDDNDIVNIII